LRCHGLRGVVECLLAFCCYSFCANMTSWRERTYTQFTTRSTQNSLRKTRRHGCVFPAVVPSAFDRARISRRSAWLVHVSIVCSCIFRLWTRFTRSPCCAPHIGSLFPRTGAPLEEAPSRSSLCVVFERLYALLKRFTPTGAVVYRLGSLTVPTFGPPGERSDTSRCSPAPSWTGSST
jgi:hypothetical protein